MSFNIRYGTADDGENSWDKRKLRDRNALDLPPIAYFNTHFDHRGRKARLESARLLRRKISDLARGCRVVLTGDFNSAEGGDPYAALFGPADPKSRALIDTFRAAHPARSVGEGTFLAPGNSRARAPNRR
jgi:endonuclease/exonuclease/phosphatase family metal-dependent hydrolase